MRAPRSLRARVTLAALAAVALIGLLAGVVLIAEIQRQGRASVDHDLRQRAQQLSADPDGDGVPGSQGAGRFRGGPEPLLAGSGTFVQVAYGNRTIERRGDVPAVPPPVPRPRGLTTIDIGGTPWRSLTLTAPGGALRVQLVQSLASVQERVDATRTTVFWLELAALALTGLAAWLFTTLALRPLGRLQAGAARVTGAQDLAMPLPDEGPEEVRSLAAALNAMLGRLEASTATMDRALQSTRRFAADAGHELRTPLTGLRANLDALERNPDLPADQRRALVRDTIAEQERILHLLEGLQALTRGDAADRLPREEVELDEVLDAAVYGARRRHPAVAYELDVRAEGAALEGWGGGLRLLVDNLLDNAALHGRAAGGRVRVTLARGPGSIVLRVEDDGAGIPAGERERLLEPFTRGRDATAPGTGLGLAIVAQQVALHGGELHLSESSLGGLAVEVRLPAPDAPARDLGPTGAASAR
jgi:two-component system sensor histidine kinase PrrB